MTKNNTTTRRTALGLIGTGTLLTVSKTFGFSELSARRDVSADTSPDADALLGIEGKNDASTTPTFTNRSGKEMAVTLDSSDDIELDVGDNGNWDVPPVVFSLSAGESKEANIRFTGECASAGSAIVDIDADLDDGSGGTVGSIVLSRAFAIPEAGQIQFVGEANSSGQNGKYSFDMENTGCEDVTFTGIGINETTADADFVSGGGSLYNVTTGETLVTDEIPIDNADPTTDTRRDLSPTLSLKQNATVTLEFDKFQGSSTPGNSGTDMRDEDVRITLYLSDGSSATVKLCMGSCDF